MSALSFLKARSSFVSFMKAVKVLQFFYCFSMAFEGVNWGTISFYLPEQ